MTSSHDLDLEDGLFDAPGPDERGVGGVRGECDGVAGLDMDGLGDGVVEEHDVVAGIDVLGLAALFSGFDTEIFITRKRDLQVDVFVVSLQSRFRSRPEVCLHDIHPKVVPVDLVRADGQAFEFPFLKNSMAFL